MSPVAVGLDLLLVGLLLTALFVGLKLNVRLKALRDGQVGFIKAVAELDTAAARAEAGLKALRAASEDTHDELLTRIETARGLIVRLEAAAERAQRIAEAAPPPAALAASPLISSPRFEPRSRLQPAAPRPAPRSLDDDLFEAAPAARQIKARP
jgi:hypothetical protein